MKHALLRVFRGLKEWRVLIGENPRYADPKSIIIFPLVPGAVFCGLAGILAIKRETQNKYDIIDRLSRVFEEIRSNGLEKLINSSITLKEYLDQRKSLKEMEEYILDLKQDASMEYILFHSAATDDLADLAETMNSFLNKEERLIEENADGFSTAEMEQINNAIQLFRDCAWALEKDVLSNLSKIFYLTNLDNKGDILKENFRKYKRINLLLNSLDKLEVRGRDSAGIQITFAFKDKNSVDKAIQALKDKHLYNDFSERLGPGDLLDGSIHLSNGARENAVLTFTYKIASITGELGENSSFLRDNIRSDQILRVFIGEDAESQAYFVHTRWASVGTISEENCHPLNNFTLNTHLNSSSDIPFAVKEYPFYGKGNWSIHVALNGDIDNYKTLRTSLEENDSGSDIIDYKVNTDTKIIPLQIERYLYAGCDLKEAFRMALNDFEGSHAIAMQSDLEPGKVFLALRGSGQSLYIGMCDNQYVFSSEVYGLVEMTPDFIKMDGETERIQGDTGTKGQVFILSQDAKDTLGGIDAFYYDGHPFEITSAHIQRAEITTRDIDRKNSPHFLLKEILEAPSSIKKTLRGKFRISHDENGRLTVTFNLGEDIVPEGLNKALAQNKIRKIFVIGQGTAGVAGIAIAEALSTYLKGSQMTIEAKRASDLSGFYLERNLDDTLIIAVTQSGTTTDTNRAVAMAKERGAHLIGIVNRRQSDITHKTDGVFYTSDGRDIEMSVASTKAFYSQIVAGHILAFYFAQILGTISDDLIAEEFSHLKLAPDMMNRVIITRDRIRESAWEIAKKKKYWAVVGSGPNKVAADEIRIKLSELCYKTISSDIVEDKKHIDLSSETLIFVCAAGNPEPVVEDIVKDVAIFKAHEGAAIVVAEEGETRFNHIADSVIFVPRSTYPMSVILNTLAGHIWGYYAACSIDEEAKFFRGFKNKLSQKRMELDKRLLSLFEIMADTSLHKIIESFSSEYHSRKNRGFFTSMSVEVVSDITLLLKYAVGKLPLEDFWEDFEEKRVSSSPLDMLDISLGRAVDELSRPIDAVRHQAKTVTVGTSRREEVIQGIIFDLLKKLNFSLENLTSKDGINARRIQRAVSAIKGFTLYNIDDLDEEGKPGELTTISIAKRSGISLGMKTRVEKPGTLKGTKKMIVRTGDVFAGLGRSDNAPIVIIPLLGRDHVIRNILLIHVGFKEDLSIKDKREIMGEKLDSLSALVNEYNYSWDDRCLEGLNIEFLLGESVDVIASEIMR